MLRQVCCGSAAAKFAAKCNSLTVSVLGADVPLPAPQEMSRPLLMLELSVSACPGVCDSRLGATLVQLLSSSVAPWRCILQPAGIFHHKPPALR